MTRPAPPSLPQLRTALKAAYAAERDQDRRSDIGRALKCIERAESKTLDKRARPC